MRSAGLSLSLLVASCAASGPLPLSRERASDDRVEAAPATEGERLAPGIEVELSEGALPWTHLDVQNEPSAFRFAIVSDRTGGARPGVFESAISRLNLLQPEFVMSVGDMIEGYSEDLAQLEREWTEFDGFVAGLRPPFFRVPGNHDLTNEVMRGVWQKRYGPTYYTFVYRDVLFVCLDTMDGGFHTVSERQVEWLRAKLAAHPDVRWTLLFMHAPLWDEGSGNSVSYGANWSRLEAALGDRPYTVFAGHHHRYLASVRNNRRLFTLATTGGGSRLRGPAFGEFDQIAWVTMTERGPLVANLLLSGILPEEVRTEAVRELETRLLQRGAILPTPLHHTGSFERGRVELHVPNEGEAPLDIELRVEPPRGLGITPLSTEFRVEPKASRRVTFEVTAEPRVTDALLGIPISFRASTGAEQQRSTLTGTTTLAVVQTVPGTRARRPPTIDGVLDSGASLPFSVEVPRQVLGRAGSWRGPSDNRFRAGFSYDDEYVYATVEVVDEQVIATKGQRPWAQDGIELRFDARPDPVRSHAAGRGDGRDFLLVAVSPSGSAEDDWLAQEGWLRPPPAGSEVACVRNRQGYVAEVKVPRSHFDQALGARAHELRVNVAVNDADDDGQSQSWWWPDWRTDEDVPGSGTLLLELPK